jgi:hypothetical protein
VDGTTAAGAGVSRSVDRPQAARATAAMAR